MFVVDVEYWADGNPWTTISEVFEELEIAVAYARLFYGLWESASGLAGETAVVKSLTLDGASACRDMASVSTAIFATM